MPWNKDKDVIIKPFIFTDDINEIIEETTNQYTAIRRVQWMNENDKPDRSKSKLEIRKWILNADGTERGNKGVTFKDEKSVDTLTNVLVKNNFGDTKEIIKGIKNRDDFKESVEHMYDDKDDSDNGEYFDMRESLLLMTDEEENYDE